MADYREVYAKHADDYEALVVREDHEGNLPRALGEVAPWEGLDVLETGAGTGRVTRVLAPRARRVAAFDASGPMLDVAARRLREAGVGNVTLAVATHDALPVADASFDLAVEGWSFGHAVAWNPSGWRDDLARYVRELERALRPGGAMVLIETMGTGVEAPFEGGHALEPFHRELVEGMGFRHRCVRTDYAFASVEEAAERAGFFFGERLAARVRERGWRVVPEFTGVYWRR